jgi:hypothetical protein
MSCTPGLEYDENEPDGASRILIGMVACRTATTAILPRAMLRGRLMNVTFG